MTKIHEKFIRNDIKSIKSLPEDLKGELTVDSYLRKIKKKMLKEK